jgi:DNA-binding protein H-NS
MNEYQNFSEKELQIIIDKAAKVLEEKQLEKRKEVITKIKTLAVSIGVTVDISDGKSKTVKKVAPKYRNPEDFSQTWTGRGVSPKWMQVLIDAGHEKSEYLI